VELSLFDPTRRAGDFGPAVVDLHELGQAGPASLRYFLNSMRPERTPKGCLMFLHSTN
jgi:hypothetical protein